MDLEGVNEQVQEASRFLEKHKGSADDHKLLKATTALVKDNKLYDAVVMLLDEAKDIFEGQEKGECCFSQFADLGTFCTFFSGGNPHIVYTHFGSY